MQIHMQCVQNRALLDGAFAGCDDLVILLQPLCLRTTQCHLHICALMKV